MGWTTVNEAAVPILSAKHTHEEMVMLQTGELDVTIEGKTTRLTPGSVAYVASNELHGWKNPGTGRSQYFVIALGPAK